MRELIVDNFAGGGGASTGIEMALGISPDIAINHDDVALAMHQVNHPATRHLCNNVWKVDPDEVEGPIGLGWFSPDCKHFSKAKGGKPVEKGIRDLAWVVVRWARRRQGGPRVIILENVEEFRTWGPLAADGRPCPDRKGATFKRWVGELRRAGYRVEWRELRACDYGAPTIRKRLFLIARRDGEPIVWPTPTHAPLTVSDDGIVTSWARGHGLTLKDLREMKPWRTAAEIIDWSLPCPSIFDTSEEIMAKFGLRAVRPLQPATMARIAKGVKRYVLDAATPFIVNLTHHGEGQTQDITDPLATVTAAHRGEKAIMTPFVTGCGGRMGQTEPRVADLPAQTLTAKADSVVVSPFVTAAQQGGSDRSAERPVHTITASKTDQNQVVAAHLMTIRNSQKPHQDADKPTHTVTAGGAGQAVVGAFLAQNNIAGRTGEGHAGRPIDLPLSTILQSGSHQGVIAANLLRQFGTGIGSAMDEPARTVMADGQGKTQLSAAFLQKYYGADQDPQLVQPLHTVTTKDRFGRVDALLDIPPFGPEYASRARQVAAFLRAHGLWDDREFVTFEYEGITVVIVDLGMRMFIARELFRAQGFPDSYIIDRRADGTPITKTDQISKCGNSVCPPLAAALVKANFTPREIAATPPADNGFFLEAAE
jgi:DNA (cytosine-5)-methyltransferase 1